MTMHSSTYRGKRVYVILKDGSSFVAKFKDSKAGRIMFFDHKDISTSNMRAMTINKLKGK